LAQEKRGANQNPPLQFHEEVEVFHSHF